MNQRLDSTRVSITTLVVFIALQVLVMLLAISGESLWIDEFWTAYFAEVGSLREWVELVLIPKGSQTPIHFFQYFVWGRLFESTELMLRMANLPLFVLGQVCLFWALRTYDRTFSTFVLLVGALHPLIWQYANEARPYILMYAGAQMVLAYLLHLRARVQWRLDPSPMFAAMFVVGGILLFGASLLGAFWVFAAGVYAIQLHQRHLGWRYLALGAHAVLLSIFLVVVSLLCVYYISSLLQGAGGSRVSTSTPATMAFAAYELVGLSGIGPGRHELRDLGPAALRPYVPALLLASVIIGVTLLCGAREAHKRLGALEMTIVVSLALLPIFIVLLSGFVMGWRVVGRHLFATIPVINLLFAAGMVWLWDAQAGRRWLGRLVAVACLATLAASALSMRFAPQHAKDDYRLAASIAVDALGRGERVWWAADYLGAHYYRLPGSFDYRGELTGEHSPPFCTDQPGIQATSNLPAECLQTLSPPDTVIFARPETFDLSGDMRRYLQAAGFVKVQDMPAIAIWRPASKAPPAPQPVSATK
jgi:hypothetical protein